MREEELIKKLEKIELPEVEMESHKRNLKMALLSSNYFKKPGIFEVFVKPLAFALPVLILLIASTILIPPKILEARALEIAKANPEIKKLIEEKNMALGEVKIKDDKAFVVLNSLQDKNSEITEEKETVPEIKIKKVEKDSSDDAEGAIVEINLKQKEVAKINPIKSDEIFPLANQEKESAKEIAESEEIIKDIIPKEATIEKIQSSFPKEINLIEKNNEIEAIPNLVDGKKARVHYILDGKRWIIKVNLEEKRVEEVEYFLENHDIKDIKEDIKQDINNQEINIKGRDLLNSDKIK